MLLLTLVVFLKRPRSRAAQLLLAYGVAGSMVLLNYFDDLAPGPETASAPAPLFWIAREISQAILPDLNLLTLYLALPFPVRRWPARTHPRLLIAAPGAPDPAQERASRRGLTGARCGRS